MWRFGMNLIFAFPRKFWSSFRVSSYFDYRDTTLSQANPFKDLKWSNVPRIKLSSLSKSDDTFPSLQALLDLYYLISGFMDYLWSCELNISNFGPADRKILPVVPSRRTLNALSIPRKFSALMFSSLIASVWALRICDGSFRMVANLTIVICKQFEPTTLSHV
uniref:Uncharacterized protein n=1 Tax=Tanacetum cinerariifolium TaxID=118510 RepID=A0A6L2KY14_TANCI|nr:hypothetical protein [Tanacetum cinerariifolium]